MNKQTLLATEIQNTLIRARGMLERGSSLQEALAELQKIENETIRTTAEKLLTDLAAELEANSPPSKQSFLKRIKAAFSGKNPSAELPIEPSSPDISTDRIVNDINAAERFTDLTDLIISPTHALQKNGHDLDMKAMHTHLLEAYELLHKGALGDPAKIKEARFAASKELNAIESNTVRNKAIALLNKEFFFNQ